MNFQVQRRDRPVERVRRIAERQLRDHQGRVMALRRGAGERFFQEPPRVAAVLVLR